MNAMKKVSRNKLTQKHNLTLNSNSYRARTQKNMKLNITKTAKNQKKKNMNLNTTPYTQKSKFEIQKLEKRKGGRMKINRKRTFLEARVRFCC